MSAVSSGMDRGRAPGDHPRRLGVVRSILRRLYELQIERSVVGPGSQASQVELRGELGGREVVVLGIDLHLSDFEAAHRDLQTLSDGEMALGEVVRGIFHERSHGRGVALAPRTQVGGSRSVGRRAFFLLARRDQEDGGPARDRSHHCRAGRDVGPASAP